MKCYTLKNRLLIHFVNPTREGMLVPIYWYVLYMIHLTCIGHIQEMCRKCHPHWVHNRHFMVWRCTPSVLCAGNVPDTPNILCTWNVTYPVFLTQTIFSPILCIGNVPEMTCVLGPGNVHEMPGALGTRNVHEIPCVLATGNVPEIMPYTVPGNVWEM